MANSGAGSKVDTVVKLALISFVVILSFAVGTFVGKQVSDADYRRAALENDYKGEGGEERGVASENGAVPDAKAITDEEIASLREEFEKSEAGEEGKAAAHAVAAGAGHAEAAEGHKEGYKKVGANEVNAHGEAETSKEAPAAHEAAASAHAAAKAEANTAPAHGAKMAAAEPVAKAAARVSEALAPSKDIVEKRKPSTALPSVATSAIGKYTVQVASFASETEAQEQVNKLKEKGFGAFYVSAAIKGQTWFRVSIGLFADQASAMDYRKEILNSRAVASAIVQKIVR